ncbi:hypothetical protein ACIBBE_12395 [Streptomyces sp. NPDC051644]|uniref:hypothetical protein n=1 Tax=Streptomyces sp. NPDC051644 TaxID=3365666 RepID=UPI0037913833
MESQFPDAVAEMPGVRFSERGRPFPQQVGDVLDREIVVAAQIHQPQPNLGFDLDGVATVHMLERIDVSVYDGLGLLRIRPYG